MSALADIACMREAGSALLGALQRIAERRPDVDERTLSLRYGVFDLLGRVTLLERELTHGGPQLDGAEGAALRALLRESLRRVGDRSLDEEGVEGEAALQTLTTDAAQRVPTMEGGH